MTEDTIDTLTRRTLLGDTAKVVAGVGLSAVTLGAVGCAPDLEESTEEPTRDELIAQMTLDQRSVEAARIIDVGDANFESGDYKGARGKYFDVLPLLDPSMENYFALNLYCNFGIEESHHRLGHVKRRNYHRGRVIYYAQMGDLEIPDRFEPGMEISAVTR